MLEATTEEQKGIVSKALVDIAADATDEELVRQIASRDLMLYPEPSDPTPLQNIVMNEGEDLDIRVNIVVALERRDSSFLKTLRGRINPDDPLQRHLASPPRRS